MEMLENICSLPTYQHIGIIILVQLCLGFVNLYLSKTEKVESNSIAELVFNTFVGIIRRLTKGK